MVGNNIRLGISYWVRPVVYPASKSVSDHGNKGQLEGSIVAAIKIKPSNYRDGPTHP